MRSLTFELFVARRYLRAKRRQAVIGVITGISIVGVAAGVASLIVALAITNGFRQDLQQKLLGANSHIQLMRALGDGIGCPAPPCQDRSDWRALLASLEKQPHVVAGSPALYDQVLISRGPSSGALIKGIVPAYERKVSDLLTFIKEGSAAELEPAGGAPASSAPAVPDAAAKAPLSSLPPLVLGRDLADKIGAPIGSVVQVVSPQGELSPFGMVPKYARFRVVGIFQSGFYDYDSMWAFTRLADAQRLFGLGDIVSVFEFKIDDIDRAPAVARRLVDAAGPGFDATNWQEQNRQLFRALRLERVVTFITIGLIVLVAALNILISLIMMVMEKTRDIAVLLSMGARKAQIRRLFIAQGVLIGLVGTTLGLVVGYGVAWAGEHYRFISLPSAVYPIDYLPFAPRVIDGVLVAAVSIGISFIATLYPSWSAARIAPAESLRYE